MAKKPSNKTLATIFAAISVILLVLYSICLFTPAYCEGTEEDYVAGLKIMEQRVVSNTILPIEYDKVNEIVSNYTSCPAEVDCEIDNIKFMDIYVPGNYTEKDMLILMTQIVDSLYSEMPFLYDRQMGFIFHDSNTLEEIDEFYVTSNRWKRKY
ncbi:hypothetical protein GF378_03175 [Candidatus Pacearchaeota archaeon]|nr:hypothetical protein [Candidatus Pacearchaeota archaeon]